MGVKYIGVKKTEAIIQNVKWFKCRWGQKPQQEEREKDASMKKEEEIFN